MIINIVYSDGLLSRTPFWKKKTTPKWKTPAQVVLSVLHLETLGILRTLSSWKSACNGSGTWNHNEPHKSWSKEFKETRSCEHGTWSRVCSRSCGQNFLDLTESVFREGHWLVSSVMLQTSHYESYLWTWYYFGGSKYYAWPVIWGWF